MSSNGMPSSEFLSLKEISESLGHKIDHIQTQIAKMSGKPTTKVEYVDD